MKLNKLSAFWFPGHLGVSYIMQLKVSILKGKTWVLLPLHMRPRRDNENQLIDTRMAPAVCQALP